MKILIFFATFVIGYLLIRYAKWLIDATGISFSSVERVLGPGGTYYTIQIIGLVGIGYGFWQLFN